jgi:hypothetical protein
MSKKLLLFILCLIIRLLFGALLAEGRCNDQDGVDYDASCHKFLLDDIYTYCVIEIQNPGQTNPCLQVYSKVYDNHITWDSIYLTAYEVQLICDNRNICPNTCEALQSNDNSEGVSNTCDFTRGDAEGCRAADTDDVVCCISFTSGSGPELRGLGVDYSVNCLS